MEKTFKPKTKIRLKINGGTMKVSHQATVNGYHNSVRFSENSITNIIALRNLLLQYLATYRSDKMMFVIHRESEGKVNTQLRKNERGLN